ncbi:MAG: flagellar hook-length control protein FliK [Oceanospirillaceae bacterium]
MDAQAIAQVKILDTKSASSARSIEVALPSGKAVQAKITQVTQLNPDRAQQGTHRVKLEVNNTVIQLSAKFSASIPEAGSSVIVQRSSDGQIQLKVIPENQTANKSIDSKPLANTTSNQPTNSQSTDKATQSAKALLANTTATNAPLTSSGDSGKVILKASVIINSSGSTLNAIELALPKGQTVIARVISQSSSLLNNVLANTSSTPLSNTQNSATPANPAAAQLSNVLTNTSSTPLGNTQNSATPANPAAAQLSNVLTNTSTALAPNTALQANASAFQPAAAPNNSLTNNTLTNSAQVSTTTSSVTQSIGTNTPTAVTASQTPPNAVSTSPTNNLINSANIISNTYSARPNPAPVPTANLPIDAKPVTTQPTSVLANTQPSPNAPQGVTQQNTLQNTNTGQPATILSNNTNIQSTTASRPPVPLAPQDRGNTTPVITNLSNNAPATATAAISQTANQAVVPNTVLSSNISNTQSSNIINSNAALSSSSASPQAASNANQQNPNIATTTPNASPLLASQTHSQPASQLSSAAPSQVLPQTSINNIGVDARTNRQNIPQNLQLNALPSNNAAIKVAVAGQTITLQAPANLPPLQSVQITRTEGVLANIQWQQVSQAPTPQVAPPILSPKQAQLMEHSLRQALPQQIPMAEGINQLVNQTAQFASIASPAQASVDKVTMSIMQLFGVKPGANNSSDTVKRNIQQGGLFTESKLVNQTGGQQGDMKNFLGKLNRLAEQLPTEQKEMLQSTTERMLARVTTNQLTHVQQQHLKADISNERSFQIDIPVQHNEKLDNVEIEIKQRKHMNNEGDFVAIWSVKLHFDLEERGEVDAEVALNPTDNTISTTFLCSQLSTVHEIEQRMNNFKNQLNSQGFEVQTLHCSQGSQAAIANNPISKRIIDIRT